VRYRFIFDHVATFPVVAMSRVLRISRSGYFTWLKRSASHRQRENDHILDRAKAAHKASKGTYGSPRVHRDLRSEGLTCSLNRVARIMKLGNVAARPLRRFAVTTDSNHRHPRAANMLDQDFAVAEPNKVWSADITYIWTAEGWLYLAVVLDLFNREVVGWSMKNEIDQLLVITALRSALISRHPPAGLICHSDQGSQYASGAYQTELSKAQAVCSMSRRGNCYDNAPVESFFSTLKREMIHRQQFRTRQEARTAIFQWIVAWYNSKRRHSALDFISPKQFRMDHYQNKASEMAA